MGDEGDDETKKTCFSLMEGCLCIELHNEFHFLHRSLSLAFSCLRRGKKSEML